MSALQSKVHIEVWLHSKLFVLKLTAFRFGIGDGMNASDFITSVAKLKIKRKNVSYVAKIDIKLNKQTLNYNLKLSPCACAEYFSPQC